MTGYLSLFSFKSSIIKLAYNWVAAVDYFRHILNGNKQTSNVDTSVETLAVISKREFT